MRHLVVVEDEELVLLEPLELDALPLAAGRRRRRDVGADHVAHAPDRRFPVGVIEGVLHVQRTRRVPRRRLHGERLRRRRVVVVVSATMMTRVVSLGKLSIPRRVRRRRRRGEFFTTLLVLLFVVVLLLVRRRSLLFVCPRCSRRKAVVVVLSLLRCCSLLSLEALAARAGHHQKMVLVLAEGFGPPRIALEVAGLGDVEAPEVAAESVEEGVVHRRQGPDETVAVRARGRPGRPPADAPVADGAVDVDGGEALAEAAAHVSLHLVEEGALLRFSSLEIRALLGVEQLQGLVPLRLPRHDVVVVRPPRLRITRRPPHTLRRRLGGLLLLRLLLLHAARSSSRPLLRLRGPLLLRLRVERRRHPLQLLPHEHRRCRGPRSSKGGKKNEEEKSHLVSVVMLVMKFLRTLALKTCTPCTLCVFLEESFLSFPR
mmetsp:Transcript_5043/g.16520  ORF Transcript_5043/g.16520 Transcript_5043/m.16520 type:complete len:430 (+) Transcript_5043:1181-2470(+)